MVPKDCTHDAYYKTAKCHKSMFQGDANFVRQEAYRFLKMMLQNRNPIFVTLCPSVSWHSLEEPENFQITKNLWPWNQHSIPWSLVTWHWWDYYSGLHSNTLSYGQTLRFFTVALLIDEPRQNRNNFTSYARFYWGLPIHHSSRGFIQSSIMCSVEKVIISRYTVLYTVAGMWYFHGCKGCIAGVGLRNGGSWASL